MFDWEKADEGQVLNKVVTDYNEAEQSRGTREGKWQTWYKLYRSYAEKRDTGDKRANLFIPYVYSIVETVVPRLIATVFSSRPYIGVLPVKEEAIENAKDMENLIDYQLTQKIGIIGVATSWFKEALIYGTSILKVGWEYEEDEVWVDEPLMEIFGFPIGSRRVKKVQPVKDDPLVEHIDLWDFYIDPRAKDIDEADYCIHKVFRDVSYLKRMEEQGIYKNIDEVVKVSKEGAGSWYEEGVGTTAFETGMNTRLGLIGMQSIDKPSSKIEILEYWTDDRVIAVANRSVVIRNDENPYHHRKKPFVRLVDVLVPHEFYGIGEIEPIEDLQYELNSLRNQRMDNINILINRMWKVIRGADIDAKQLVSRPGGIIEVDDMDDVQEIQMTDTSGNAIENVIEMVRRDMDNADGVYDYARGETTDRRETATTASLLSQAANERFNLKVKLIEDLGMRRLGVLLTQLNQQYIDTEKAIRILGQDGMDFYTLSPENIRGQFDIMPLGSSVEPITNKENKLQSYINLYTILKDSPYVNHPEIIKKILEAADIKDLNRVIIDDAENMLLQNILGGMANADPNQMQQPVPIPNNGGVMENGG